jgi:hypothetical protein
MLLNYGTSIRDAMIVGLKITYKADGYCRVLRSHSINTSKYRLKTKHRESFSVSGYQRYREILHQACFLQVLASSSCTCFHHRYYCYPEGWALSAYQALEVHSNPAARRNYRARTTNNSLAVTWNGTLWNLSGRNQKKEYALHCFVFQFNFK